MNATKTTKQQIQQNTIRTKVRFVIKTNRYCIFSGKKQTKASKLCVRPGKKL